MMFYTIWQEWSQEFLIDNILWHQLMELEGVNNLNVKSELEECSSTHDVLTIKVASTMTKEII